MTNVKFSDQFSNLYDLSQWLYDPFYITLLNILQNYYSKDYTLANDDLVYLSKLSNFFLQYIIELNSGLPGLCYWVEDFQILGKPLNCLGII